MPADFEPLAGAAIRNNVPEAWHGQHQQTVLLGVLSRGARHRRRPCVGDGRRIVPAAATEYGDHRV